MGHALNNTIQDVICRFKRMNGYKVLWIPGTDHAGIATQTVVKKHLDEAGIDYHSLGRKKFIEKIWEWKDKYGNIILEQIKALGSSCDWSRYRFTMDQSLVRAVNYAFKKLYDDGLIYQGNRIVNWCPVDQTALSDDEVEKQEGGEDGFLYNIKYFLKNRKDSITISTTRPETIFGDSAVAVHPQDPRYKDLIGKKVIIPFVEREVSIIADEFVKQEFGTGCLKVTPAHDPNDFEIGKRHKLDFITVMDKSANMNENVPANFQNLNRYQCRKKVINELKKNNQLEKIENKKIPLGRSYRSKEIIEYRLSEQWFVSMPELTKKLIQRTDELNFYPKFYKKIWLYWLENVKDWCISRQIWWGHQIPVWINQKTKQIIVSETTPEIAKNDPDWVQEEDVLDTWFSSALWPLSTMGWPEKTEDFKLYFPTATLSTAKDIIFFWVARMCLMSLYFEDKLPFKNIYFHPTIMDHRGKVMSKSKGNGIDPLHIIFGANVDELKNPILDAKPANSQQMIAEIEEKYPNGFTGVGADSLRFTLMYLSSNKQFIHLSLEDFVKIGRRFINKLWNGARFLLLEIEKLTPQQVSLINLAQEKKSKYDIWLKHKLNQSVIDITSSLNKYELNNLGTQIYDLVWHKFCDWYIEFIKYQFEDAKKKIEALSNAISHLRQIITLAHPVVPFITEEINTLINERLPHLKTNPLIISDFPIAQTDVSSGISEQEINNELITKEIDELVEIISHIRASRKKYNIQENKKVNLTYSTSNPSIIEQIKKNEAVIKKLTHSQAIIFSATDLDDQLVSVHQDIKFYFPKTEQENRKADYSKEIKKLTEEISFIKKKLENKNFINKGKPEVIKLTQEKLKSKQERLNIILQINN